MDTRDFCRQHGITCSVDYADSNPNMLDDDKWQANHYKVTLKHKRRSLTVYFSQGMGISQEPDSASVLDCLASDSSGIDNAGGFEEWAREYGYDTDSIKALKTFKACATQAKKLKQFLGEELYKSLLSDADRL